jgi:hypothetical protein
MTKQQVWKHRVQGIKFKAQRSQAATSRELNKRSAGSSFSAVDYDFSCNLLFAAVAFRDKLRCRPELL